MFFSHAYFPVFLTQPGGIPVKVVLIGCLLSARARDWLGSTGFQTAITMPSVLSCVSQCAHAALF